MHSINKRIPLTVDALSALPRSQVQPFRNLLRNKANYLKDGAQVMGVKRRATDKEPEYFVVVLGDGIVRAVFKARGSRWQGHSNEHSPEKEASKPWARYKCPIQTNPRQKKWDAIRALEQRKAELNASYGKVGGTDHE